MVRNYRAIGRTPAGIAYWVRCREVTAIIAYMVPIEPNHQAGMGLAAPQPRRAKAARALEHFEATLAANEERSTLSADARERLLCAFAASDFLAAVAASQPAVVAAHASEAPSAARSLADYRSRLSAQLGAEPVEPRALGRILRRFRAAEAARIAWRDLFGLATIDTLLAEQSALAEACIGVALEQREAAAHARYGVPRNADGEAQSLVVLAMGKLGGGELNFSSDIDLIFVYGENGTTDGERRIDNAEFFTRVGRDLIQSLDERTVDGFAYRVDMRLRPFGSSGPLVMHLPQLEQYLLTQAREWERFALVKARALTGDDAAIEGLAELLRPFVFRRYLDFGAFEALRDLKSRLERQVARKGMRGDVKYGHGGIREVEFIAQAFQLIRGGREPALRTRSVIRALQALADSGELSRRVVDQLVGGYRLLRRVENRLQWFADERTHALPQHEEGWQWLAWTLGEPDAASARRTLDEQMARVHGHFEQVFNIPAARDDQEDPLAGVWEDEVDGDTAQARLAEAGFAQPAEVAERLRTLRKSTRYGSLSTTARERFDRLMPLLLTDAGATAMAEQTLNRLLTLVEAVASRSVYLSLLIEHAGARQRLVELCAASPWIAEFVANHPIVLDELLDPESLFEAPDRASVTNEIDAALAGVDPDDLEAQMDVLRQVKQVNVLRVAAVDITGRLPLMRVSDHLTWIAEAILETVVRLVREQLIGRHGRPRVDHGAGVEEPGFAVVAYGKLGGFELGYGSDLDLVFLHDGDGGTLGTDGERALDNQTFFARLTQRMIHFLNTATPAGVLYEIDTRLRPNGASGALVSSLTAFRRYQQDNAWTWEHQALVRARVVAGDRAPAEAFAHVRAEVLGRRRDNEELRTQVAAMRERMRTELARERDGAFDLKQGRGGVADIEFVVQYEVLRRAHDTPALIQYPDNIRLLEVLAEAGHLRPADATLLTDAYRAYRTRLHRLALLGASAVVTPDAELAQYRDAVTAFWYSHMEADGSKPT